MGRARAGGKQERGGKESRAQGSWAGMEKNRAQAKEEKEERETVGWAARGKKKEGRGGEKAGWAGPKGEKRDKNNQMLLSLNMKFEFKFKSK
jgi:hypothetical protein